MLNRLPKNWSLFLFLLWNFKNVAGGDPKTTTGRVWRTQEAFDEKLNELAFFPFFFLIFSTTLFDFVLQCEREHGYKRDPDPLVLWIQNRIDL